MADILRNSPADVLRRKKEQRKILATELRHIVDPKNVENSDQFNGIVDGVIATVTGHSVSGLSEFRDYIDDSGHLFSLEDDVYPLVPDSLQGDFIRELSIEDQFKILLLVRTTIEGIREREVGPDYKEGMPNHFVGDIQPRSSEHIEHFVLRHVDALDADAVAQMARVPVSMVSEEARLAALASCLRSEGMDDALPVLHVDGPIVIFENRRGYVSCPDTEDFFKTDIESGAVGTLHVAHPDGEATFKIKSKGAMMGLCVESDNPDFEVGMTYIPVGSTKGLFERLQGGKEESLTIEQGKEHRIMLAKNREVENK